MTVAPVVTEDDALKESLMKTSITAHIVAMAAAAFVTFGAVDLIADYAYPVASPVRIATAGA